MPRIQSSPPEEVGDCLGGNGGGMKLSSPPGSHSSLTQSHTVPCVEELLCWTNMGREGDGGETGEGGKEHRVRG